MEVAFPGLRSPFWLDVEVAFQARGRITGSMRHGKGLRQELRRLFGANTELCMSGKVGVQ